MKREEFDKAFLMGFMVTREGYNADCIFEHLAPKHATIDVETATELLEQREFIKLRDQAWIWFHELSPNAASERHCREARDRELAYGMSKIVFPAIDAIAADFDKRLEQRASVLANVTGIEQSIVLRVIQKK